MTHIQQVFAKGTLPPPGSFCPGLGFPEMKKRELHPKREKQPVSTLVMDQAATEMAPASENQYSHTTKNRSKR